MDSPRNKIIKLSKTAAASCTGGALSAKQIQSSEAPDYFAYSFYRAMKKFSKLETRTTEIELDAKELKDLAILSAFICTQSFSTTRASQNQGGVDYFINRVDYFINIYKETLNELIKRQKELTKKDIEIPSLEEEDILELTLMCASACTQGYYVTGQIYEIDEIDNFQKTYEKISRKIREKVSKPSIYKH